jgi:hypothetical protein
LCRRDLRETFLPSRDCTINSRMPQYHGSALPGISVCIRGKQSQRRSYAHSYAEIHPSVPGSSPKGRQRWRQTTSQHGHGRTFEDLSRSLVTAIRQSSQMMSGGSSNGRYRAHLQQQLLQEPDTLCATRNAKTRTMTSRCSLDPGPGMRATPISRWSVFLVSCL